MFLKLRLLIVFFTVVLLMSFSSEQVETLSLSILHGGSSKHWKVAADTIISDSICGGSNSMNNDNRYIFQSNGIFRFDNGTDTTNNGLCTDSPDLMGNYVLHTEDSTILFTVTSIRNMPVAAPKEVNGKILNLANNEILVYFPSETLPIRLHLVTE